MLSFHNLQPACGRLLENLVRYRLLSSSHIRFNEKERNDIDFAGTLGSLDSSINTMEKILTVLQNAQSNTQTGPIQSIPKEQISSKVSESKFLAGLGNNVFELKVIQVLNDMEIINNYDVFKQVGPEATKSILGRYVSALKGRYTWEEDTSATAMENIGRRFAGLPLQCQASLASKIRKLSPAVLVDVGGLKAPPFQFDFPTINMFLPFRYHTQDPLVLRKGLSMKRNPLNLLAIMVNDVDVVSTFLSRSRSKISPLLLQNFMASQSLEGAAAFKLLIKKHLRNLEPERAILSPFEGRGASDSDMEIVKAIVASRSKLMLRIMSYRDYKFGLLNLNYQKYNTNEKVVQILADIFDRFFGVCYRADAKYCDTWVKNLIEFYLDHGSNEELFEQLFADCINNFKLIFTTMRLEKNKFEWGRREKRERYTQLATVLTEIEGLRDVV